MKFYYLTVGLAGAAAALYLPFAWHAEPIWLSFVFGYICGTPIAVAISMHIRERDNAKPGGFW